MPARLADAIDRANFAFARAAAWIVLIVAFGQFAVMVQRHVFDAGAGWQQVNLRYVNGVFCMAGLAYALHLNAHVRVDILYRRFAPRLRALIDLAGACLFAIPCCALLFWGSSDYVIASWAVLEGASDGGGVPLVFLYKTMIWVAAVTLGLQAVAMAVRAADRLRGGDDGQAPSAMHGA